MATLDFGTAAEGYFRWQVNVPDTGELPAFSVEVDEADLQKSSLELTTPSRLHGILRFLGLLTKPDCEVKRAIFNTPEERTGVVVRLPDLPWIKKYEDDIPSILILWIQERGEWIVVMHRQFTIPGQGPGFSYRGPFGLNSLCKAALARAHGLRDMPNDIGHKPPNELERTRA